MHNIIRIFLAGDVMTGRGIDQVLPHPSLPHLYEPYVRDARSYVQLAEEVNGKFSRPITFDYIWGDALTVWEKFAPHSKIINLETAITLSEDYWPEKGIHYRMHPDNSSVLTAAHVDVCVLANNHILDWGYSGLSETLRTLNKVRIHIAGAGENISNAMAPAIMHLPFQKRLLVFSCGDISSGVFPEWKATTTQAGLYFLPDLSEQALKACIQHIDSYRQPNDLVVLSIHWGSNWGYEIPNSFRVFAQGLIDAAVNVVHGHSSHHPRAIEIYKGKLILYGCGDFINDYEGIGSYEEYRGDLSLMYFLDFDSNSLQLKNITLVPMQIKNFRLHLANQPGCEFILKRLNEISFGVQFRLNNDHLHTLTPTHL